MKRALIYTLGILYILSPIVLIPDFIPVFGWLDDLGVSGCRAQTYLAFKNDADP